LPPAGGEALDSRSLDEAVAEAALREIACSSALFGGNAAVKFGLKRLMRDHSATERLAILDVGAGAGEGTLRARRFLGLNRSHPIALDHHRTAARMCKGRGIPAIVGDMRQPPVRNRGIDIVVVNLVLHHFARPEAVPLLARLDELARIGVVIADLRRSAVAAAGFGLAGRVLRFHEVTRRDGQLSIRRGFTATELVGIIREAGIRDAVVHRRPGWRLVAYWKTSNANS